MLFGETADIGDQQIECVRQPDERRNHAPALPSGLFQGVQALQVSPAHPQRQFSDFAHILPHPGKRALDRRPIARICLRQCRGRFVERHMVKDPASFVQRPGQGLQHLVHLLYQRCIHSSEFPRLSGLVQLPLPGRCDKPPGLGHQLPQALHHHVEGSGDPAGFI